MGVLKSLKIGAFGLVFVLALSFTLALVNESGNGSLGNINKSLGNDSKSVPVKVSDTSSSYSYTSSFYYALLVGLVGLLIVLYLVYAFLRRPKDKWER